jgi:hypothetical protein
MAAPATMSAFLTPTRRPTRPIFPPPPALPRILPGSPFNPPFPPARFSPERARHTPPSPLAYISSQPSEANEDTESSYQTASDTSSVLRQYSPIQEYSPTIFPASTTNESQRQTHPVDDILRRSPPAKLIFMADSLGIMHQFGRFKNH